MSTSLPMPMPMPIQRGSALLLSLAMILGALVPFLAPAATRAAPTELFFSEYIEGSSNNKALEIYNGTGAAVDLVAGGYNVQMFFNGSATAGLTINLTGTVAAGDVFVLAQSSANAAILAQADQTNGAGWFNGDDAVVLRKGTAVIDSIGQIGFDPGAEWGTGLASTADNTLRRKPAIEAGDADGSNVFDPAVEWDGFATDTLDGLGAHGTPPPDTAPSVTSTAPANGASGIAAGSSISVTFTEPVAVTGTWFTISCGTSGAHTATVSGGPTAWTLDPDADFATGESCTVTILAANVSDADTNDPPDAMGADHVFTFTTGNDCGAPATLISQVQGEGTTSPMAGQTVTVEAVVVGDFQNNASPDDGNLGLFFVQEEDADADGDSATSEGMAVFSGTDVATGDVVRVTGRVVEFPNNSTSQITELTSVSSIVVCDEDANLPAATAVSLPVTDPADFERWEGMLVTFPQALTISEFFNYDRFGEIALTVDRDFQPTAVYEPDSPERAALAEENLLNRITLDDGLSAQNPEFTRHPNGEAFTLDNRFRGGDTLTNVTGVIDHSFGLYRVQPTEGADYTAVNLRPEAPDAVGGSLTVASFNVLNYFTTLTSAGSICGPSQNQECRGADTAEELARQQAKIVAALATMDADVVGLIEIENHHADVPTATLVQALNDEVGAGTYDYIATGGIGTDVIRVAFIYKPANVTPVGDFAILDSSVDDRFNDDHNRPVLAQAFEENATGGVFTMAVNHLKSKGSGCGGPPDDDPVQGNCNGTRTLAAEALVDWLATDPTESGDLDALIIGDLNSYDKEDPIDAIRAAGYTDLVHKFGGELAYSYLFDGQLGYLDTALASPTLTSQVTGTTVWHINADEPDLLDYDMSFKSATQDTIFAPDAYRSSDHDPVIVGLDLLSFGFEGVEPPLDETNTARAGSTVPVKFELAGDLGLDVLHEPLQVYDCGGWPSGDSVDAVSADGAGLRYDADADQYVFAWKTSKAWAGECKALVLTLDDGSYLTVEFEFRS